MKGTIAKRVLAAILALSATTAAASSDRVMGIGFEPADGGFFDFTKPGTGLTLTKVTPTQYYGLYYGYNADGTPMWRSFIGEFVETWPGASGREGKYGRISAQTYIVTGGQVLGGAYRAPVETLAPEGKISITFHSSMEVTVSYGGSNFKMNFAQVAHAAEYEGETFGIIAGGRDTVELRAKVDGELVRAEGVAVTPAIKTVGYSSEHMLEDDWGSVIYGMLCSSPPAEWTGDLAAHISFDRRSGRGAMSVAEFDPAAQAYVLRKQLATLVAARDGIVFHGKTCEGLDLEGVILPNRSQMVYFDLADE